MNVNIAVIALLVLVAWFVVGAVLSLAIAPCMRSDDDPVEGDFEGWGGDIHGQPDALDRNYNHG